MIKVCRKLWTYFTQLQREFKTKLTLEVVPAPCDGATPNMVLECAIQRKNELTGELSRDEDDPQETVWALIDLEAGKATREKASEAKKKGEKKGVGVALSNPTFPR